MLQTYSMFRFVPRLACPYSTAHQVLRVPAGMPLQLAQVGPKDSVRTQAVPVVK